MTATPLSRKHDAGRSHRLSERFSEFAESECKDSSPLYYSLSRSIAQDEQILAIASQAKPGQPVPNLLFASVHYLLAADKSHHLREFYPSCIPHPKDPSRTFPAFKDFVETHRNEIIDLLKSRLVQTNEVKRSAYLFPALVFAAEHFESRPLALVEIGTSAGLNLVWDHYRYSYGQEAVYGDLSSPVTITSTFRGPEPAVLSAVMPRVSHRIGLDLNIVDTSIQDQADWLRALVWPEHHERRELMDAALMQRSRVHLDLREGDGFSLVEGIVDELPVEALLCVYHTHVANQISEESRRRFLDLIDQIGSRRDIIHVFNNIKPNLHLTAYRERIKIDAPLANTDGHAKWIEWLQATHLPILRTS